MSSQCCSYAPLLRRRVERSGHLPSRSGNEVPEAKIIRRAQQGDGAAFEHIYRTHGRRIFGLCRRMVDNPTDAEDLTQEAFLQVFRKIQTFRGDSALYTWLHRLTLNIVFMHLRKRRLRDSPLGDSGKTVREDRQQEKELGGPDFALAQFADRFRLEHAVDQLPATCKTVFVLHEVQGYKHREIAEIMESSVATSKVRLHRARARLRELLQPGDARPCEAAAESGPS